MNLVYYKLNLGIDLLKDKFNMLVIENPAELESFVIALDERINKQSSDIELFNQTEKEDLCKRAEVFYSPQDFKYEKKEVQKKLFSELIDEIQNSEGVEKFSMVCGGFFDILDALKVSADFDLEFEENFGLNSLLKSFDIHLKNPEGRFVEKFIEYSSNVQRLLGKELFILVSCIKYMTKEDMEFLYKHALYKELSVLFIEDRQIKLNFEINEYIIDSDLCELH